MAGPHGAETFLSYTSQQSSMFPGYDNDAASGFSQLGPLSFLAQPVLQHLVGQAGMYPGQFQPTHNAADLLRADMERTQAQKSMADAARKYDTETWLRTSEGVYRTLGVPYGLDQQAAFRQTYQQFAPMMSMVAQFAPGLVDSLHGSRGSAALLNMGLTRGGRYRSDATGMPTMSGEALQSLTGEIENSLYGTPQALGDMRGVGMGSLGQIFDEAGRRGYLPASIGARGRQAAIQRLSEEEKTSIAELNKLGDEGINDKLRNFDSRRIAGRLKELAGSVSAMRDIFGAMGQADAPMSQLINSLEMLTQNRLSSMSPGQVEQIVRQTKSLMQTTGMNLDGVMRLTAQSSAYGQQLGLAPEISVQSALGSVAYAQGYKENLGGLRGFNVASLDEVTARDVKLRQQAAASQSAMSAAAAIRVAEAFGVDPGSKAGQLVEAIKRRDATFDGRPLYEVLQSDSLTNIFKDSGAGAAALASLRDASRDRIGNQETIHANRLGDLVRDTQQPLEVISQVGATAGRHAVIRALESSGVDRDEARKLGTDLGPTLIGKLLEMSPEDLSKPEKRREMIETALADKMGRGRVSADMVAAVGTNLDTYGNASANRMGFGNMTQMIQSAHKHGLGGGERTRRMAEAEAKIDGELSRFGKADWAQRLVDLLQSQGDGSDKDLSKLVSQLAGNIDFGKDENGKLGADALKEAITGIRSLSSQDKLSTDQKTELDSHYKTLRTVSNRALESAGLGRLDVGRKISDDQVDAAAKSGADVSAIMSDRKLTPEERAKKLSDATNLQMARTRAVVQGLYIDQSSLKKLGKGGLGRVQQVEAAQLELLRLAGGDSDKLAAMLAGDATAGTAEERARVKQLQASLTNETKAIGGLLGAEKPPTLTDAEWAEEKKLQQQFIDERSMRDEDQTSTMLDKLDAMGGMKLSKEDKAELAKHMGKFGSSQRHDIGMAIKARERLEAEAKKQGKNLDALRKSGQFAEDFQRAGDIGNFRTNDRDFEDKHSLGGSFDKFAPTEKAGSRDIKLTGGNIKVDLQRGTASLNLAGTTDFSNHA